MSSPQLDVAERGFSFGKDGPLDMRMDPDSGESAAQWINRVEEREIADVLWTYGEERQSRRIARAIVARREKQPFSRTAELAELIASVMPRGKDKIHPATRSFRPSASTSTASWQTWKRGSMRRWNGSSPVAVWR